MALFESYDRRIDHINAVLKEYGINGIEDAKAILAEAGAMITHPSCGLCCGRTGGILTDGERVVATNNRNFLGRMGTSKVEIFLASPVTAAACAVAGKIVVPEVQ